MWCAIGGVGALTVSCRVNRIWGLADGFGEEKGGSYCIPQTGRAAEVGVFYHQFPVGQREGGCVPLVTRCGYLGTSHWMQPKIGTCPRGQAAHCVIR